VGYSIILAMPGLLLNIIIGLFCIHDCSVLAEAFGAGQCHQECSADAVPAELSYCEVSDSCCTMEQKCCLDGL
jgi:hypothetical protein